MTYREYTVSRLVTLRRGHLHRKVLHHEQRQLLIVHVLHCRGLLDEGDVLLPHRRQLDEDGTPLLVEWIVEDIEVAGEDPTEGNDR